MRYDVKRPRFISALNVDIFQPKRSAISANGRGSVSAINFPAPLSETLRSKAQALIR
jgi:hypothetical protein